MEELSVRTPLLGPGARLDRYEILRQVGHGGMGNVWLARARGKHGFEKFVAIKTILPSLAREAGLREMFMQEAKLAACVEHANVAQILDLGEDESRGLLYIVQQWVDGRSIDVITASLARRRLALPVPIVLRIVADACAGLHAAHDARDRHGKPLGIVHCDVSPQNVLVDEGGIVKIIDFGVARVGARDAGPAVRGKVAYMSPEQARGRALDARADVWALGAVLYELVAGRPPVQTLAELAEMVAGQRELAPLPRSAPGEVRLIAARALSVDPAQRFATANEMRHALEHAILSRGQPTTNVDVARFIALHLPQELSLTLASFDEITEESAPDAPRIRRQPAAPASTPSRPPRPSPRHHVVLGGGPAFVITLRSALAGDAGAVVHATSTESEALSRLRHEAVAAFVVDDSHASFPDVLRVVGEVAPSAARVVLAKAVAPREARMALNRTTAHGLVVNGMDAATVASVLKAASLRVARERWMARALDDSRVEAARLADEEKSLRQSIEERAALLEELRRINAHADNAGRVSIVGESEARRSTAHGRPLTVLAYRMRRRASDLPAVEAAILYNALAHPGVVVAEQLGELIALIPDSRCEDVESLIERPALAFGDVSVVQHERGEPFARTLERAVSRLEDVQSQPPMSSS